MLQQDEPDDYVIATGEAHSVREFLDVAAILRLEWQKYAKIDPHYFRPTEVNALRGDASKARKKFGWAPKVSFTELVQMMVEHDLELAEQERTLTAPGTWFSAARRNDKLTWTR